MRTRTKNHNMFYVSQPNHDIAISIVQSAHLLLCMSLLPAFAHDQCCGGHTSAHCVIAACCRMGSYA